MKRQRTKPIETLGRRDAGGFPLNELFISTCVLALMVAGIGVMIAYGVAWWKQALAVLGFIVGIYVLVFAAIFLRKDR